MTATLVTGATGFLGSHVCRLLLERGDEVVATVRSPAGARTLERAGARTRRADVSDRASVRRAMRGVTRVFHVAGVSDPAASRRLAFAINAEGARIVLEEALRAGVERLVLTSSIAAIGPALPGASADERNPWRAERLRIPFLDAAREAEATAARLVLRGLPVVIVNPALMLGPGDPGRSSTLIVRRFLCHELPFFVDGTINIVGVEDVARGHLLADLLGVPGERYILGNRNFTVERLMADLARLSGVQAPALRLPAPVALALARAPGASAIPGLPSSALLRLLSLRWAMSSRKARRELRWSPSPHEDCLEATVAWYREREGDRLRPAGARQPRALRLAGTALGVVRRGR